MTALEDAHEALYAALDAVEGLSVPRDMSAALSPPAAILAPPRLSWGTVRTEPTEATFTVYVVVRDDKYAMGRLWSWVQTVVDAIDGTADATFTEAEPALYQNLPAYEIPVNYPL